MPVNLTEAGVPQASEQRQRDRVGSLPGIWLGSRLLKSLNPQVTRTLLSTLLATIGIKLLAW